MALNELQQAAKELGLYNKNTAKKQKKKREERHNYWVNKTNENNSNLNILDPLGLFDNSKAVISLAETLIPESVKQANSKSTNNLNNAIFPDVVKSANTTKRKVVSYGNDVNKDDLKNYIWSQTGIMPIDPQNRRKSTNNPKSQTEENNKMNKVDALLTGGAKISNDLGINTSQDKKAENDKIISDYEAKKLQKKIENKTITQDEVNELYDYVMWYSMSNEELKNIVNSPTDSLTDPMTGNPYKEEKRQKAWSLYGSRLLSEVSDETKYKIEKDLENDKRDEITIKNRLKEDGFDNDESDLMYNYITGNYTKGTRLAELIEDHPVAMSLASVMLNEVSGLPAAVETATELIDKVTDSKGYEQKVKNGDYELKRAKNFQYTNAANEIRSGVSKKIAESFENENLGKAASLVYGTGMSILDNITNRALGGDNKALSLGLMSSTAFSNQIVDTINNGGTITEAAVKGIASAVIEAATENISWNSMQNFLGSGKNGFISFMLSATKEALPEGMEEGISYVAGETFNALYDSLSAASNGDFTTRFIPQYDLNELLENVVSGILSGYGMSSGAAYAQSVNTKITGNIYLERGKENIIIKTAKNNGIKTAYAQKTLNALNEFCENEYTDTEEDNDKYFKLQNKAGRAIGALNNTLQEKLDGTALQEYNNQLNDTNEGSAEEKYSAIENNNTKDFVKQFLNQGNTTQSAVETVNNDGVEINDGIDGNGAFVDNTENNIGNEIIDDNTESNIDVTGEADNRKSVADTLKRNNRLASINETAKSETALQDLTEHIDDQYYRIVYNETVNVEDGNPSTAHAVPLPLTREDLVGEDGNASADKEGDHTGYAPTNSTSVGESTNSAKGFSATERSAEFNRIYDMGTDEDIPPHEIESDIFTPEQVRRIYAAAVIDDNKRNNLNRDISFKTLLKVYENKANKVQELTDELITVTKGNIKGIKAVLFERLNADQRKITKFLNSKKYEVQWFSAKRNVSGFTDGNTIYLNASIKTDTALGNVTFKHEFAHTLENLDGFDKFKNHIEESKIFKDWIQNKAKDLKADGTFNNKRSAVVNSYIKKQNKVKELSNKQAENEMYADFVADTLFSGESVSEVVSKMEKAFEQKSGFKQFVDGIINALRKIKGFFTGKGHNIKLLENEFVKLKSRLDEQNKNTDSNNGVKYEINPDFKNDIKSWERNGKPNDESFILGSTGDVLQGLGARENDIYINGSKINTILKEHPEMSLDVIEKIPEILENPILVLSSKNKVKNNTRMVMFGRVNAENGKPVLCVLDLIPTEDKIVLDDMQKAVSAYSKTNSKEAIKKFFENSEVLYASKNKKITANLISRVGFYMPTEFRHSGYIGSITYEKRNVNIKGKPFNEVFSYDTNNSISENSENDTDIPQMNTGKDTDNEIIDRYTEKQYNNFGWVRANNVLTSAEYQHFNNSFSDNKNLDFKFTKNPTTKETIIPTGDNSNLLNVLVYTKGTFNNPVITKVVRINSNDTTDVSIIRSEILEREARGYKEPYTIIEDYAGKGIFVEHKRQDYASFQEFNRTRQREFGSKTNSDSETGKNRTRGTETNSADSKAGLNNNSAFSIEENNDVRYSAEEKMQGLVEKYGAIPKGMNAERDIQVPKKTSENMYVSYAGRSIMEKGSIDENTLEKNAEQICNEVLSHKRLGDKEALDYADRQIKDGEAERIWGDIVSGQRKTDKYGVAVGEALLEMYANKGDAKKVLNITAELCEVGTRVGQSVQAFSLLKKMGGVGRVYYLQKVRNQINKEIDNHFGEIRGEKYHVVIGEEEVNLLLNAKTDEEVTQAAQKITKSLGEQLPSTFLDKWNAWRYLAMLGNTRTHIRNLVGNAVFVPAVKMKNGIATAIEHIALRGNNTEQRTKALKVSKEVKEFAEKDYFEVEDILTSDGKFQEGGDVQQFKQVFTLKVLRPVEAVRKLNFKALEKEDAIFLKLHYKKALGQFITARKLDINNLSEEQLTQAREYAVNEAKKATYRDASAAASAINRLSRNNIAANLLIEGTIPFKKTPINIIKRGIEYSPIGLIKTISKGIYDFKKRKEKFNASAFIDGLASGLTGTGIMVIGTLLGALGLAVGGFGGDDDEWFRKLNGEQEYALVIGNKSYTVDWAAPACIPFFIGVELQRILSGENENYLAAVLNSLDGALEPITNLSMLQGINDTISTAKWSENPLSDILTDTIASYFTQALPTLGGQITRTLREERKKNYIDKNSSVPVVMQRFLNTVKSKTGEFGKTTYRNAWGETEPTGNGIERILQNFLSPGYLSTVKYDEVNKEIQRLYESDGNKAVLPDSVDTKITQDGNTKYLNAEEYEKYQTQAGQNSYKYLKELFNTSIYKEADDDNKAEMIADVYSFAVNVAKTSVSDYKLSESDSKIKDWLDNGISAPYSIAAKNVTKDLDDKSERHDALEKSSIPSDIKKLLQAMNIMGSKKIDTDEDGWTDTAFNDLSAKEQKEYINKNNSDILKMLEEENITNEKQEYSTGYRNELKEKADIYSYPKNKREQAKSVIDNVVKASAGLEIEDDTDFVGYKTGIEFDESGFIDIENYIRFKTELNYYNNTKIKEAEEAKLKAKNAGKSELEVNLAGKAQKAGKGKQLEIINKLNISQLQKNRLKLWVLESGRKVDLNNDGTKDVYFNDLSSAQKEKYLKNNANYILSSTSSDILAYLN